MLLIYMPGATGADPQHLARVGLGDLLEERGPAPTCVSLDDPDRVGLPAPGVVAYWPPVGQAPPRLEDYEWQPASERLRFQLGKPKGRRIGPAELARPTQQMGTWMELADKQHWLIPLARQLPQLLGLDEAGRVTGQVMPQYSEFWDMAWRALDWFVPDEQGECKIDYESAFDLCATALGINYRINREVAAFLGLISSDLFWPIARAVVEFEAYAQALKRQKKTAAASTSDTPSTAPGGNG